MRGYTKWDDQPASPGAAREALLRGAWIANTAPQGPVYINLDAEMQEAKLTEPLPAVDAARYTPPIATAAPAALVQQAAAMLKSAKQPVILAGRASRSEDAWNARVALAEALNARVDHRSQDRRELPDRSSALCRRRPRADAGQRGSAARRRRDCEPGLGRPRRRAEAGARRARRQSYSGLARLSHPQRLEHGLSRLAGCRSLPLGRSRSVVPELVKALGAGGRPRPAPPPRAASAGEEPPASPTSISRAR